MSDKAVLLIRADATPRMGTGHVMRCLALAQAAQDLGFTIQFVGRTHVPWVQERLRAEHFSRLELPDAVPHEENPVNLLHQLAQSGTAPSDTWVVLDGYHFTFACQQAVRDAGYRLLVIDDYAHLSEYSCDILLNQNLGAETLPYAGDIGQKLLGPRYVLLRREFQEAKKRLPRTERHAPPQNILVTLGGGDFIEYLEDIAQHMNAPAMKGRTVRVIQGAMRADKVKQAFVDCPAQLEVLPRVADMPALLLSTDLCITAGGSTCWELCCLGVPFLATKVANNQEYIIDQLKEKGMLFSKVQFQNMICCQISSEKNTSRLIDNVDGYGAMRVIDAILNVPRCNVSLRTAAAEDKFFVFCVANTNLVREMSFNSKKISRMEHDIWYDCVIKSRVPFYIFYVKNARIGYVRFSPINHADHEVILTIALSEAFRGKGLGKKVLRMACHAAFDAGIKKIWAYVKKENKTSEKLFSACGFMLEPLQEYKGFDVYAYSLERV